MAGVTRSWTRAFSVAHRPKRPQPPRLVLFEDSRFMILNKPTGVAIQGQHGSTARLAWDSLIADVTARPESPAVFPVHRLDKATTGCLVLAKSSEHAKRLAKQFQTHSVKRTYLAVVHGAIKLGFKGEVTTPLAIDKDRVRSSVDGMGALHARTDWECVGVAEKYSLLRLEPTTGRKHQLRVHCSETLKASVVGDYKYAPSDPHRSAYDLPPNEMLLHSYTTRLYVWDKSGKRRTVSATAPIPSTFASFCEVVGLSLPAEPDETDNK